MKDIFNINEAIAYLKDGALVTSDDVNNFIYKENHFIYRFNGSSVSLNEKDFIKAFKDSKFSLIKDSDYVIDELKDKEYYERYKK